MQPSIPLDTFYLVVSLLAAIFFTNEGRSEFTKATFWQTKVFCVLLYSFLVGFFGYIFINVVLRLGGELGWIL